MQEPRLPFTKDLVLIGGGHSHALVLQKWAMKPLPGARVTVINPGPTAPYSGMLPGYVAGHYGRDELNIDLVRLARMAGARLVMGAAHGIDRETRRIQVTGQPDVAYDIASVDVGITSAMPELPGFSEHGIPAKPLGQFAAKWSAFADGDGPARVIVIGGGVAGAELAMAMAFRLRSRKRDAKVCVIDQGEAFSAVGPQAAEKLRRAFARHKIELLEGIAPESVSETGVSLTDGRVIEADFVTGAAGAHAHPWVAGTDLTNADGFIPIDTRLRSKDPSIFAVGDCAEMVDHPRPKAGVYAVRQAPVLYNNLRAALSDGTGLQPYVPQKDYLKLISLGGKSALAERFGLTFSGSLLWQWKDHIDTTFMAKFDPRPYTLKPPLPWPRASGAVKNGKPMCGGCGAKVGMPALHRVLHGDEPGPVGDDAAILQTGNARQVITHDHLRAMTLNPVTLTRIAAIHAMGDVWAMGATQQAAVSAVILPEQAPELAERHLREITQVTRDVMAGLGVDVIGGHTTMGAEMTIGFTVTGICKTPPITLEGAQPGDHLILTKPIGSGVMMAAEMESLANGDDVTTAYRLMTQPQGEAAQHLAKAHAMTDVTGFGLAGHAMNMARASGVGVEIILDAVPLMQGALLLSEQGVRSSLYEDNRQGFEHVAETALSALLFDPQTSGGLLAAVGSDPQIILEKLQEDGFEAAVIGRVTDKPGQLDIV